MSSHSPVSVSSVSLVSPDVLVIYASLPHSLFVRSLFCVHAVCSRCFMSMFLVFLCCVHVLAHAYVLCSKLVRSLWPKWMNVIHVLIHVSLVLHLSLACFLVYSNITHADVSCPESIYLQSISELCSTKKNFHSKNQLVLMVWICFFLNLANALIAETLTCITHLNDVLVVLGNSTAGLQLP